ncbi:MAG: hypothetical protein ACWA5L_04180 [bacterium]
MSKLILSALTALTLSACTTASATPTARSAGHWVFNPRKCPDLMEDYRDARESRRDERYDRGPLDVIEDRLDRRESRRDRAVTHCPASAWEWQGPHYRKAHHPARPARATIYYNPGKKFYYRNGPNNTKIVIRF